MAEFRSKGRILDYNPRNVRDLDEMVLWTIFSQRGSKYKDLLHKLKPEIACEIIEKDVQVCSLEEEIEKREHMDMWYEKELKDVDESEDEEDESFACVVCGKLIYFETDLDSYID